MAHYLRLEFILIKNNCFDRASIPFSHCYVLSKEYPGSGKKKFSVNLQRSLDELQIHIDQLKKIYGQFMYAPPQTLLSKTKPFKFVSIMSDPDNVDSNLEVYLDGFSPNVQEIISKFKIRNQLETMREAGITYALIEKLVSNEINLGPYEVINSKGDKLLGLTNLGMGYVFEELIRKFNEENNEEEEENSITLSPLQRLDIILKTYQNWRTGLIIWNKKVTINKGWQNSVQ